MSKIDYQVIRSKRKTISIRIAPDGEVIVRCPLGMRDAAICAFVTSKTGWIEKHLAERAKQPQLPAFTEKEIQTMTRHAREVIPEIVAFYAPLVGTDYGKITIRHQKSRWGSCSSKGNLNFNCLLMAVPPEVLDYVVVHELCHRKEMNHSKDFWLAVERILPDYRIHRQWLKTHGTALIDRLQNKEKTTW